MEETHLLITGISSVDLWVVGVSCDELFLGSRPYLFIGNYWNGSAFEFIVQAHTNSDYDRNVDLFAEFAVDRFGMETDWAPVYRLYGNCGCVLKCDDQTVTPNGINQRSPDLCDLWGNS